MTRMIEAIFGFLVWFICGFYALVALITFLWRRGRLQFVETSLAGKPKIEGE
jgi:uncharacterized membrane protein